MNSVSGDINLLVSFIVKENGKRCQKMKKIVKIYFGRCYNILGTILE